MGLAAKGMVASFVIFTVLNVEFANSIYSAVRGWIEASLSWYYILTAVVMHQIHRVLGELLDSSLKPTPFTLEDP